MFQSVIDELKVRPALTIWKLAWLPAYIATGVIMVTLVMIVNLSFDEAVDFWDDIF